MKSDMENDNVFGPWVHILRTGQFLQDKIDSALKENGLPNLVWYDVLLELSRVHPEGLRSFELGEALLLKQYNLSRQIGRMEKAGVVQRQETSQDGRGFLLVITDMGLQQKSAMWKIYSAILHKGIGDQLTMNEAENLVAILRKLHP